MKSILFFLILSFIAFGCKKDNPTEPLKKFTMPVDKAKKDTVVVRQ